MRARKRFFAAAQRTHTPLDYVYLTKRTTAEQLAQYEVLFYPHITIAAKEQAALLEAYVENGGTLVIGCRSGYKNTTGQCVMEKLPGVLAKLTGAERICIPGKRCPACRRSKRMERW